MPQLASVPSVGVSALTQGLLQEPAKFLPESQDVVPQGFGVPVTHWLSVGIQLSGHELKTSLLT